MRPVETRHLGERKCFVLANPHVRICLVLNADICLLVQLYLVDT